MSGIVVMKFGGSSVAGAARLRLVAERIKGRRAAGTQLVVVVSAMGDTTDELLALARGISERPPRRELDMLLSCGERISMALLSMALAELGVPAISFTGSQSGIITDENHAQARIVEVRPSRIRESVEEGKVVIVAGYQGVSRAKEVTTLGRGGSDTTAVALAAALGADCEIYSDVDGIFTADPRVIPSARKLEALSYDEMQALAAAGARVLNADAVQFARDRGITIEARSAHGPGTGTRVTGHPPAPQLVGVTCEPAVWLVSHREGAGALAALLHRSGVVPRQVHADAAGAWAVVPLDDVHAPAAAVAGADPAVSLVDGVGTVTCVGSSALAPATLTRALGLAASSDALKFVGSPLQLTWVVPAERVAPLAAALHELVRS